ncbi:c6 zinc finger domain containing protein [Niveomyces insectorum RCEF 264]|uniref:C6 zinc finger domain containing protein n=1 Tax=Niveomyces insectorum RCEF 264 TaxID=1081102 RepID=A0A167SKJ4_9HYPO|nr:c6 zinc finger domain containing protein [Niveomyces insectorum RCEF 264]
MNVKAPVPAQDTGSSSSSVAASPCASSGTVNDGAGIAGVTAGKPVTAKVGTETPRAAFGEMHFAGYELGNISSHFGIPLFSVHGREWIKARTGVDVGSRILCPRNTRPGMHHMMPSMLAGFVPPSNNLDLPPRPVVERYLDTFWKSKFRLVFPVIDQVLFAQTIDAAYEKRGHAGMDDYEAAVTSLNPITAKASIFSFLAVLAVARFEFRGLRPGIDGDACASKAQHLVAFVLHETNVAAMQTVMMLTLYSLFIGEVDTAIKTHAIACRMLFMLGGHLALPSPPPNAPDEDNDDLGASSGRCSWRTRVHLRNVFWLCYTFDKNIALRTGQPPCLEDAHCDLTLPQHYADLAHRLEALFDETGDPNTSVNGGVLSDSTSTPWLPGDLRLSVIKSKTYRMLYSADALRKPDADLVHDIRELDEELERWRLSVPAHMRPQLFYAHTQPPKFEGNLARTQMLHRTVLHFEYHYLIATIHRAVGRCRAWGADGIAGNGVEVKGLESSLLLSVEASRATIFYLRLAIDTLFEDAFWLVFSYPMSAILTLFGNIMMYPLDPRSSEDLRLLNLAPDLLKQIQPREWTPRELTNIRMVESFVDELIRLGSLAISKAKAAQNQMHDAEATVLQ